MTFLRSVTFASFALLAVACSSSTDDEGTVRSPAHATPSSSNASKTTTAPRGCYADARNGCQDVSWSTVETLIDVAFDAKSTYYGYDKQEARAFAREIYDHGLPKESGLAAFKVRADRVVVSVRDESGRPVKGLGAASFQVKTSAGATSAAPRAKRVGDATSDDVRLRFSTVVDDSGSISDCDARFIADGLDTFFTLMPPIHTTQLIKFDDRVQIKQSFTSDGAALSSAARTTCTDRGSTALWDGTVAGLGAVNASTVEGELPAVIVFSDGFDNDSNHVFADVVAASKEKHVPVFVIGIGIADPFALTKLARETGGGFVYVPSGTRIVDAFQTAGEMLTDSYVVDLPADAASVSVALASGAVLSVEVPR